MGRLVLVDGYNVIRRDPTLARLEHTSLELARDIRRRHPGIPVILTTGYVDSVSSMTDGEFDVLLKPFSGEALAKALGAVR